MTDRMQQRADDLVRRLVAVGAARPGDVVGCSEAEIRGLEAQYGVRLPPAYRAFLARLGKAAGKASEANTGLSLFYPETAGLTAYVRQDPLFHVLPEGAYVFATDQSIRFWFFVAGEGPADPEVFSWFMEAETFEPARATVWEFLERQVMALATVP